MKTDPHWEKVGRRAHHGICVPLFAIHSKNSEGMGDFLDLIPLISWIKSVGFDLLDLLPLNDTGTDLSPYNPISSCALDPVYLNLKELGIETLILSQERTEVRKRKLEYLHPFFLQTFDPLSKTDSYRSFVEKNSWLSAYTEFKALKEMFNDKQWFEWPEKSSPDPKLVDFHLFLQYHAFRQMGLVRAHAEKEGIFIKGDVPILLNPDSADVREDPSLFRLDVTAGAPPDKFNEDWQAWGFPLFNWDAMRSQGFKWWKRRLQALEPLYHIYRIDHAIGFFRIWGVPKGAHPSEGSFFPKNVSEWETQGKELFEMMIDASPLLPVAEDLGTIHEAIHPILREFGICGTKVVRWERYWGKEYEGFIPFETYEPYSMTTLSTHDVDTLELWWKKFPSEAVPFAFFMSLNYHPLLDPKQRLKVLRAMHKTPSYFHINLIQEYLALFPELVWPELEKERINFPGTVGPWNWTYRLRPSLEELFEHQGLREAMKSLR